MPSTKTFQALPPEDAETLVAVMQRIVPHTNSLLQEAVWETALSYDSQLVPRWALRQQVRKNLHDLDIRARQLHGGSFAGAPPTTQDALLHDIEDTEFFQGLVNATVSDYYNRHVVWEAIGYPGLAQRDGAGYLHKGFDRMGGEEEMHSGKSSPAGAP